MKRRIVGDALRFDPQRTRCKQLDVRLSERSAWACFSTRAAKAALSPAAARRDSAKSSSFCVATPLGPLDHIMTQHQCCADDQREHVDGLEAEGVLMIVSADAGSGVLSSSLKNRRESLVKAVHAGSFSRSR